jgi:hypothetical protein
MTLYAVPMSLLAAPWGWVWPPAEAWWLIALARRARHHRPQCFTRAFAIADASAMVPFDFAKLPFAALIAWLAYGEVPDGMMWVGAAGDRDCHRLHRASRSDARARYADRHPRSRRGAGRSAAAVRAARAPAARE